MLPSLLGTMIFIFIPFLDVIFKSFFNSVSGEFVAFKNYINIFNNEAFKLASFNTFKFICICIPLLVGLSLLVAILLNNMTFKQEFFKTTFLIPTIFTVSVLSLLNSFKVFREAYLVAGEYPHNSMYMLQHTFNNWFNSLDIDKLSAGATVLSVIIFILILMLQKRLGE